MGKPVTCFLAVRLSSNTVKSRTVKMHVASVLSHTMDRVYLKRLSHSSVLPTSTLNSTWPCYRSVQDSKAMPTGANKMTKKI